MSEQEYQDTWQLSAAQMCWRRNKIIEVRDPGIFQREYPANPAEAWSDGAQQVSFDMFAKLMKELKPFIAAAGRE